MEDGVGHATAIAFARAGASAIAVADLHGVSDDSVAKIKKAALQAGRAAPFILGYKVDIADRDSVMEMHDEISRAFNGHLDVVVNSAAHMEPDQRIRDSDPEMYWRTWEVNVRGLLNMIQSFLPLMLSTREHYSGLCTMINVSSSGALSAKPRNGSYRCSKLAGLRWTESLYLDYGNEGLLTFCVNPGAIKTRITKDAPKAVRDLLPDSPDIAGDTIVWLASERREWLGGRYVSCPWDMEILVSMKDDIVQGDKLKLTMTL
ncbi:hypothetical protein LTS08_006047 [Lithohypha guttulata]|nr:hypothetical protein LTS08_006047 [Lithohypha guttulata]